MNLLFVKLFLFGFLVSLASSTILVTVPASAVIGSTVNIVCSLYATDLTTTASDVTWRRYTNYNTSNILNLKGANIPARYSIVFDTSNATASKSTITITGVTADDFSTYECSYLNVDSKNLVQATTTSTTTTSTTTTTTSTTSTTTADPVTLCYNGTYNSVLYSLFFVSLAILGVLFVGFIKLIKPNSPSDILIIFGVVIGTVTFVILMAIFWISPTYVSSYPSNNYWAPIVIVPSGLCAFFVVWFGILFFTIRSCVSDKILKVSHIIVISVIAFCQLVLLLVILCSVVYCTGQSAFPALTTNYSIVTNICAGLIVISNFIFFLYFVWMFKEQVTNVSVIPTERRFKSEFPELPKMPFKGFGGPKDSFKQGLIKDDQPNISINFDNESVLKDQDGFPAVNEEPVVKDKKGKKGKGKVEETLPPLNALEPLQVEETPGKKGKKGKKGAEAEEPAGGDDGVMDVDGDDVDGGDKPKGKKGKGKKAGATSAGLEKPPVADENPEGDAGDGETPGKKKGKKAKKVNEFESNF